MSHDIEVEIESIVGRVRGVFVAQDEYQAWLEAHPDSAVISTAPMLLVIHQKLPSNE